MAKYYRPVFCCKCGKDSISLRSGSCFVEVNVFFLVAVNFLFIFLFCAEPGSGTNAACCIGLRQSCIEALVRGMIASAAESDKRQLEVMSP